MVIRTCSIPIGYLVLKPAKLTQRCVLLFADLMGIKLTHAKGFLAQYLEKLWSSEKTVNNSRIYGEILYLFADNILITLYPIPSALKK